MKKHIALPVLFAVLLTLVLIPSSDVRLALAQGPSKLPPVVSRAVKSDRSLPLNQLRAAAATAAAVPHRPLKKPSTSSLNQPAARDPLLSSRSFNTAMPSPIQSFDGTNNVNNAVQIVPPDPNGDVGYDPTTGKRYYVQWNNLIIAMWDVTGTPTLVLGPIAGNAIWSGFGGLCETTNFGDPIALFDPLAQRWLLSQFAFTSMSPLSGPFSQCIAISQTSNPTGSYFRYQFPISNTNLNDYPKFGVWPDAYYMSTNQFDPSTGNFVGARATAFERDKMLTGSGAQFVTFDLGSVNINFGGQLPSDLDGLTPPPTGAPNYFAEVDEAGVISPSHATLAIWQFHVDWTNPANSTFGTGGQPNQVLSVTNYNVLPCVPLNQNCIPQPGKSSPMLDPIGDRLMNRLQYRNYTNHESLVANHTVDLGGTSSGHAGIRWYELHKTGSTWSVNQEGTYGPDSNDRWLGSIAADRAGDIAIGYSLSSTSVFPSIMYAGRLVSDPLGTLPQTEVALMIGSGAQTGSGRWGDYSMLAVDPLDDCTFWYTNEYYPVTSPDLWHTRIGAFRFPSCLLPSGAFDLHLPLIFR